MAITFLPPKTNTGSLLGQAIGQGLQSGISHGSTAEFNMRQNERTQERQASRLQQALSGLDPNSSNFIENFKQIAPALATTPGGPQLLAEISPILSTIARNNALTNSLGNAGNRRGGNNQVQGNAKQTEQNNETPQQVTPISNNPFVNSQNQYLNPQPPQAENTNYPQRTANYQPQQEMSSADIKDLAGEISQRTGENGQPVPYDEALKLAQNQAKLIAESNNRLYDQQQQQEQALEAQNQGYINRAQNNGLIKDPEDITVLKKFAKDARNAAPGQDAWEYIRTKMGQFDAARSRLQRNYTLPTLVEKVYRKLTGTFKEKEQAMHEMQKDLDFFRNNGLYDQARDILTNTIGFGPEDTELSLFPFDKRQSSEINSFPKNPNGPKPKVYYGSIPEQRETIFPGEKHLMPNDKFLDFKNDLSQFLTANENINLIGLRGRLNQDKGYAWQDIAKAINQLREEDLFRPNVEQEKQLGIIENAPIPGLGEFFKYMIQGKK